MLLDTEGLGDINKGDIGHDNKIFTLAALLCNVLVYNMMSAFNQDAVEKLTFITEMSKKINFKSSSDVGKYKGDQLALILPTFVLCLRDFTLLLEKDGTKISADQYLEECLELKPEKDSSVHKYNKPRECIRKYFPTRKCFTFDRPGEREVMQRLEKANTKDLSKSFIEDTQCFLDFVYTCKGKVLLSSKSVRGKMFASLVESYVHSIRNGAVPDVDDAIMVVSKLENRRMAASAIETFKQHVKRIKLPILNRRDFDELFQNIQKTSLRQFRLEAMFESEPFEKEASREMEELWKQKAKENLDLTIKHCYGQLQRIHDDTVAKQMRNGKYNVAGGYAMYRLDIAAMKTAYKNKTKTIDCYEAQTVLHKFLENEGVNKQKIIMADQKLTEADIKSEMEHIQKANQKAQQEQRKLFDKKIVEEKERSEKHLAKIEMERQEHIKQEKEKMKLLTDKWKDQKELSEKQIEMMKTENEKQREQFKLEMKKMNEEIFIREQEGKERFQRLLEDEQANYKEQIRNMDKTFTNIIESEKQKAEQFERQAKLYKEDLIQAQKEQEEEREWYESETKRLESEKTEVETKLQSETKEKKQLQLQKQDAENAKTSLDKRIKEYTNKGGWHRMFNKFP